MNPYETLGVARDATASDIKKAFRKKASEAHPDHGGSPDDFVALKRAHAVLSSPEARRKYDTHGELPPEGAAIDPDHVARALIANMISGLIETAPENFATQDLVHVMKENMRSAIRAHEDAIAGLKRKIARAEKLKGRFTRKAKKKGAAAAEANFMEAVIGGKIVEYRRSIAANEDGVKLPQRALEILGDYEFKPEAPGPSQNDLARMMQNQLDQQAAHAFFGFRNNSAT